MDCQFDRRAFLRGAGAAGAGLLFLRALPGLPRRAVAGGAAGNAKRLLVFNLHGGLRSSAAFLAAPDGEVALNPWGTIPGTGTPFLFGRLLDDTLAPGSRFYSDARDRALPPDAYRLGAAWKGATVPRFREWAARMSVLGTWNRERGDHIRARLEEVTGAASGGEPGLLTRVGRALAAGSGMNEIPAFQIQPTASFGLAPGDLARFAPVGMAGPRSLPSSSSEDVEARRASGNGFGDEALRSRLDDRLVARRAGPAKGLAEVFALHRRAGRAIGERLAEPWLAVGASMDPYAPSSTASHGEVELDGGARVPLTNDMLRELVVKALGPDPTDPARIRPMPQPTTHPQYDAAINTGLAVRLLQLGSPAVVVEIGSFDYHSGEVDSGPVLYRFLGRILASIGWLLSRIPEPGGAGSMLDHTLCFTMSDFGRDPGLPGTGFNGGDGTDHGSSPACYYLAHALMGGGVIPGRLVGGVDPRTFDASRDPGRKSPRQLLAASLAALGLDHRDARWGFEDVAGDVPIPELFA